MGEMRERMLRGELYIADDPDSAAEFARVQELLAEFDGAAAGAWDERDAVLRRMLRHVGEGVVVRAPFSCEYGAISIGDARFVNVDAVMLDVDHDRLRLPDRHVRAAPDRDPSDRPEPRRLGWEYGEPSRSPTTSGSAAASSSAPA